MKMGYAARKGKSKAKKAANKKKKLLKHGDAEMADAVEQVVEAGMEDAGAEAGPAAGGRSGHKAKVELKRALKVRVASLKQSR